MSEGNHCSLHLLAPTRVHSSLSMEFCFSICCDANSMYMWDTIRNKIHVNGLRICDGLWVTHLGWVEVCVPRPAQIFPQSPSLTPCDFLWCWAKTQSANQSQEHLMDLNNKFVILSALLLDLLQKSILILYFSIFTKWSYMGFRLNCSNSV